ncbi:MAG: protein phosphatase 2C domain-containing protein [Planctomycetota bacterium]
MARSADLPGSPPSGVRDVLASSVDEDLEAVTVRPTRQYEVALVSAGDPQKEESEDGLVAVEVGDGGLLVCVVDGMGGMYNGREAARTALEVFAEQLVGSADCVSARSALVGAFERAHAQIQERCPSGGATAACAVVTAEWVQTVHAGDAEALVVTRSGAVPFRTIAHSPVGYAQRAGLLDEEEALVHAERHLVSNGLGVDGMAIHLGPRVPFDAGDTLVVATDGVTDNARESEIVEALRGGGLQRGTEEVFTLCRERMLRAMLGMDGLETFGKPDDLTLVTVRRRPAS